ncbi:argininosuccinate lyase [bacterium]|nr:argininosuccinate lyase [bacterium]
MSDGQLWSKDLPLDRLVHDFTVGNDPVLDMQLVGWDLLGTAAHVRMLARQELIPAADAERILSGLQQIRQRLDAGEFSIDRAQEDCHTAIEQALQRICPQAAGNVHLGRSRNDQVLTALRLYMKHSVLAVSEQAAALALVLNERADECMQIIMPGYTHLRRAMPSTVGRWLLAFSSGMLEELHAASGLLERIDSCPLGSGAGFGLPLPLDRQYTAELLGFSRVQLSEIDCANSRGRHEIALASWICSIGNQLEKLVWDLSLYSTEEFGFLTLPDEITTGSSIMPQKRNPDVLELMRARCGQLRAWRNELEQVHCGLPSSYHRDYQLLKPALFSSVMAISELLEISSHVIPQLRFNAERLSAACSPDLFATQEAYRRVREEGLAFRDAYRSVGREVMSDEARLKVDAGNWQVPVEWLNDCALTGRQLEQQRDSFRNVNTEFREVLERLLES